MLIIPIDTSKSSYFTMSVNLGETVCNFRFLWNQRDKCWYCDFTTSIGKNLGIRLVEGTPLLGSYNRIDRSGDFRVMKGNRTAKEGITYENLGSDYILVWGTTSEWEEADGV